jgi:carbamate kinase
LSTNGKRTVVALGGHAIAPSEHAADIPAQFAQSRKTAVHIADLIQLGHHILLTHGNGPQVGQILRRVEIASKEVYPIDLGLCVADTQAGMGYMISQCLSNELRKRGVQQECCCIVTSVLVDKNDPAFQNPTKPIGPYLNEAEAKKHAENEGWRVIEVPGRGFRRVVPSPKPIEILELPSILAMYEAGHTVIACGGGGIPVIRQDDGKIDGVEAVIDKDATAALLAAHIAAERLAILTDTPCAFLNYGKPDQEPLRRVSVSRAAELLKAGHFPAGSMGPKVQGSIDFLRRTTAAEPLALITSPEELVAAIDGETGTVVERDA